MASRSVLLLDGFCRIPWMEDKLVESSLSSTHRLKRISCHKRDPKSMDRVFDVSCVSNLEKELSSGEYQAIVVADLILDLNIFEEKIGPILQKFVWEGGAVAFPTSELVAVSTISKLFGTQWIPGEYTRTDWVVCEENVEVVKSTFGPHVINTLKKKQCVALRKVPSHEKCYGLTPAERTKSPPLPTGQVGDKSGESKEQDGADATSDFDVCVAVHDHGKGCIAFFGETDCQPQTLKLISSFLSNRSPPNPVDAFARLGSRNLEQVRVYKDQGNEKFRNAQFMEAIQTYQQALDIYGDKAGERGIERNEHANLFANQAECYLRVGDNDKAVESATMALKICPDHFKARMRRIKAFLALARSTKAPHRIEMAMNDLSLLNASNDEERNATTSLRDQANTLENFLKKKKAESFQNGFARAVSGQAV